MLLRQHPLAPLVVCVAAVVVLVLAIPGSGFSFQKKTAVKDPRPKADYGKYAFTFSTLEGKKISLADYAGKAVLVNIWAPWCGPCRKEAPGFLKLYKEYKSKGFEILSVAVQTNETDVRSFVSTYAMPWPVGIRDEVAMAYRTYGLPDNYVFGPDGSVAKHFVGFTSEEALRNVLEALFPATR
jgi:thiol-disulfide isomerase/thioredoxin